MARKTHRRTCRKGRPSRKRPRSSRKRVMSKQARRSRKRTRGRSLGSKRLSGGSLSSMAYLRPKVMGTTEDLVTWFKSIPDYYVKKTAKLKVTPTIKQNNLTCDDMIGLLNDRNIENWPTWLPRGVCRGLIQWAVDADTEEARVAAERKAKEAAEAARVAGGSDLDSLPKGIILVITHGGKRIAHAPHKTTDVVSNCKVLMQSLNNIKTSLSNVNTFQHARSEISKLLGLKPPRVCRHYPPEGQASVRAFGHTYTDGHPPYDMRNTFYIKDLIDHAKSYVDGNGLPGVWQDFSLDSDRVLSMSRNSSRSSEQLDSRHPTTEVGLETYVITVTQDSVVLLSCDEVADLVYRSYKTFGHFNLGMFNTLNNVQINPDELPSLQSISANLSTRSNESSVKTTINLLNEAVQQKYNQEYQLLVACCTNNPSTLTDIPTYDISSVTLLGNYTILKPATMRVGPEIDTQKPGTLLPEGTIVNIVELKQLADGKVRGRVEECVFPSYATPPIADGNSRGWITFTDDIVERVEEPSAGSGSAHAPGSGGQAASGPVEPEPE